MYDTVHDVLDALRATPEILSGLLEGISQSQAETATGGDEGWSVIEVLCHLRDAEEITIQRMQAMRDQADPPIIGYDQEALARERHYSEQNLASALQAFKEFRRQYIAELSALRPEEWARSGQHNELGQITILAHSIHHACHDAIHCAQIARQLAKKSA